MCWFTLQSARVGLSQAEARSLELPALGPSLLPSQAYQLGAGLEVEQLESKRRPMGQKSSRVTCGEGLSLPCPPTLGWQQFPADDLLPTSSWGPPWGEVYQGVGAHLSEV